MQTQPNRGMRALQPPLCRLTKPSRAIHGLPCMLAAVMQSYGAVSGAVWIGLNSVANPGAQSWRWAGGQNYDPTVQVRLAGKRIPTHRHDGSPSALSPPPFSRPATMRAPTSPSRCSASLLSRRPSNPDAALGLLVMMSTGPLAISLGTWKHDGLSCISLSGVPDPYVCAKSSECPAVRFIRRRQLITFVSARCTTKCQVQT